MTITTRPGFRCITYGFFCPSRSRHTRCLSDWSSDVCSSDLLACTLYQNPMMLVLVLGDNMWLMFVGWEGVGLCSFALIGFWYKVQANSTAGNKAFIVNRVGDLAFVIALYSLFAGLQALGHPTLVTREVAKYAPLLHGVPIGFAGFLSGHTLVGFVTLLMFIGATGKSAQIPLYVWLPDAMAGATPGRALIHAATKVAARVYIVGLLNFLFLKSAVKIGVSSRGVGAAAPVAAHSV